MLCVFGAPKIQTIVSEFTTNSLAFHWNFLGLPEALLIVILFPVVFITGFGVADRSIVTAFNVPLTDNNLVGLVVPMPTLPKISLIVHFEFVINFLTYCLFFLL